jgi:hypothetical protein
VRGDGAADADVLGRDDLNVPVPLIVVVSLLALAALAGMAWRWLRNRAVDPEPAPCYMAARVSCSLTRAARIFSTSGLGSGLSGVK